MISYNRERWKENMFNLQIISSFFLLLIYKGCNAINCFSCTSRNQSDPHCEDPVAPYYIDYTINCKVPKEGHLGQFPANFCVKLIGVSEETGETLVTRTCVLEDMNSQCGRFKFQNDTMKGCILTCEHDGCNFAVPLTSSYNTGIIVVLLWDLLRQQNEEIWRFIHIFISESCNQILVGRWPISLHFTNNLGLGEIIGVLKNTVFIGKILRS